jgi:hypothetical protein
MTSTEYYDIVITVPSIINWNDYNKELKAVEDESNVLNFKVKNLPIKTSIGNKCYVCWRGNIVGWMKISGLVNNNFICSTTGKHWTGNFIQRTGSFNYLEIPIPMKGFQGFRYINNFKNNKYELF